MTTAAAKSGLYPALLAFQAEAPTLPKNAVNPHFKSKFTSLDTIVEVVRPLLAKHSLVWSTFPCRDETGAPALRYQLVHAGSGESIDGTMPLLLTKQDPQGQGSAITYARRYSICSVLNLIADEDDDGSRAAAPPAAAAQNGHANTNTTHDPMSATARAKVIKAFRDAGVEDMTMFLTAVGLEDADLMTVSHAVRLRQLLDEHTADHAAQVNA